MCCSEPHRDAPASRDSDQMRRVDRKGVEELAKIPDCGAWVLRGSSLRPVKTAMGITDNPTARSRFISHERG
jgi:hypothetical protein